MAGEKVAVHELFGINEELNTNTGKYAYVNGELEYRHTLSRLQPHTDLFIKGGLERLAERNRLAEQDKYKLAREEGRHNDLMADDSGFIALLSPRITSTKEEILREIFEVEHPELDYPELVEVEHPNGQEDDYLLGFKFPVGLVLVQFEAPRSVTDFDFCHDSNQFKDSVWTNSGRLNMRANEVTRIETTSGMLWQNPAFTPQGAPR